MKKNVTARFIKKITDPNIRCAMSGVKLYGYAAIERTSVRGKVEFFATGSWTGAGLRRMLETGLIEETR